MSNIDRNRPLIQRKHPEGYRVVTYLDDPGVYYDETGSRCSKKIAKQAGFDIKSANKDRAKIKLRANYEKQIGAKFAAAEAAIDELINDNPGVIADLIVVDGGDGSFTIEDGQGNSLVDQTLSQEEAVTLYAGITGDDWNDGAGKAPNDQNRFTNMPAKDIRKLLKDAEIAVPTGLKGPTLVLFALEKLGNGDDDDNSDLE